MIAEEIILDMMQKYKIKLYGFNSTTLYLFGELSYNNVECINLGDAAQCLFNVKKELNNHE